MSIRITCPHCQGVMEAKEDLLGAQALCPFCRKVIKVEKAAADAAAPPQVEKNTPPISAPPPRSEKSPPPDKTDKKPKAPAGVPPSGGNGERRTPVPDDNMSEYFPKETEAGGNSDHRPPVADAEVPLHVAPLASFAEPPPPADPRPEPRTPKKKETRPRIRDDAPASTGRDGAIGVVLGRAGEHREKRNRLLIMLQSLFRRGSPTDVSLVVSGIIGAALTCLFYLAIFLILPQRNYLRDLLAERTWVQYATVYFTIWAAVMLVIKYWKIATQQISMTYDLLPVDRTKITPSNVHLIESHIKKLPVNPRNSFLIKRILMALDHFKARKSVPEVSTVLDSQADTDGMLVDSSYAMLKVLIWCIPILGFIGTVIGISQAVHKFDRGIQAENADIAVIKSALGEVTNGLAIAFDTTFLGLILSMVIMFPTNSVQKAEEDLLSAIDQYCNEHLLPRLENDIETRPQNAQDNEDFMRMMVTQQNAMQEWQRRLEYMETILLEKVVDTLGEVRKEISKNNQNRDEAPGAIVSS